MSAPRVIVVLGLLTLPAGAEPVTIRMDWDGLRTTIGHGDFSPALRLRTGPDGSVRVKGKLAAIDAAGISLERRKGPRFIGRDEIRSVRLVPSGGRRRGRRKVAAIAAVPIGIASFFGGCVVLGGCGETPWSAAETAVTLGMGIGVPSAAYRLAWRADRRAGAIVMILDEDKDKKDKEEK